ncbi:hypothetical protein BT96DRAFT_939452 [Gymnopus androsaceus JB14]|uniref:PEBP-like protein n=1 Tax=Gymnopus androsaceus JB14 TaxID=1447944 RepID=A0A6A4HLN0_9AGAR|nr:hypothetical protein BT96DRAFT_939452 [Gymnopus androsaceus JB14]
MIYSTNLLASLFLFIGVVVNASPIGSSPYETRLVQSASQAPGTLLGYTSRPATDEDLQLTVLIENPEPLQVGRTKNVYLPSENITGPVTQSLVEGIIRQYPGSYSGYDAASLVTTFCPGSRHTLLLAPHFHSQGQLRYKIMTASKFNKIRLHEKADWSKYPPVPTPRATEGETVTTSQLEFEKLLACLPLTPSRSLMESGQGGTEITDRYTPVVGWFTLRDH